MGLSQKQWYLIGGPNHKDYGVWVSIFLCPRVNKDLCLPGSILRSPVPGNYHMLSPETVLPLLLFRSQVSEA